MQSAADGKLWPSEEHRGPYTYMEYVETVLLHEEEGDLLVLFLVSLMWQLQVTVVVAQPDPAQIKLRHDEELKAVDMVLVYNGSNHYSPAGTATPLVLVGDSRNFTATPSAHS